jgi:hypothetical protein
LEKAVGREFKKLKERVEMLEAIVTDMDYDLSEKTTVKIVLDVHNFLNYLSFYFYKQY